MKFSSNTDRFPVVYIFSTAFVEGVSVLAIEILAGMIMSSYYGASNIAWALTLGFSILSLAIGYLTGGLLSNRIEISRILSRCLIISSFLTIALPLCANKVFNSVSSLDFYPGLVFACLILIVPPTLTIGCTTSLLIQLLKNQGEEPGKAAGMIYGISTVGGVLSVFVTGYFAIPEFGVSIPLIFVAFILLLVSFLFLRNHNKRFTKISVLLLIQLTFTFIIISGFDDKRSKTIKVTYESEGILGQLKVLDHRSGQLPFPTRRLLINGIPQTYIVNQPTAYSLWRYPHFIAAFSTLKPKGSAALLIGFGGGSVARELKQLNMNFEAVEIDKRIIPLAEKYFYYDTKDLKFTIDDARHFIKKTNKKYDLIVYDVLTGEAQPNYVFTKESLKELERLIDPESIIIINYQGILNDKKDKAFKSLYKTFQNAGFNTYYWATDPNAFDDIIFILSKKEINFTGIDKTRMSECCRTHPLMPSFLNSPGNKLNSPLDEIPELTDDKPILDHLNRNAILKWRSVMLKDITNLELKEGVGIYK